MCKAVKKKIGMVLFLGFTVLFALYCANGYATQTKEETQDKKEKEDKIKITCMIFPQYDWLRQVIGEENDRYDIELLLDSGAELHSYQPTVEDMAKISSSDFFFYVGGESDSWVTDAIKSAKNPNLKAVSLLEMLKDYAKEEEEIEGAMEHRHTDHETEEELEKHGKSLDEKAKKELEKNGDTSSEKTKDERENQDEISKENDHAKEYDEHLWLSIRNAEVAVDKISEILSKLDIENASTYQENSQAYEQSLQSLDEEYQDMAEHAKRKTILFGDRFPFRYLADDYGLHYYAAFEGCSAETGVSFETIIFLAGKMDEQNLPAIFTLENSNEQLAKAIVENTKGKNQEILTLHSMQSVTKKQIQEDGISYLGLMRENLKVMRKALN